MEYKIALTDDEIERIKIFDTDIKIFKNEIDNVIGNNAIDFFGYNLENGSFDIEKYNNAKQKLIEIPVYKRIVGLEKPSARIGFVESVILVLKWANEYIENKITNELRERGIEAEEPIKMEIFVRNFSSGYNIEKGIYKKQNLVSRLKKIANILESLNKYSYASIVDKMAQDVQLEDAYRVLGLNGNEPLDRMQAHYRSLLVELNANNRIAWLQRQKEEKKRNMPYDPRTPKEKIEEMKQQIEENYNQQIQDVQNQLAQYENAMKIILDRKSESVQEKEMSEEELQRIKDKEQAEKEKEELKDKMYDVDVKDKESLVDKINELEAKLQLPDGVLFEGKLTIGQLSYVSSKVDRMNKRIEKGEGGQKITMEYSLIPGEDRNGAPLYYVKVMGELPQINGWAFIAKIDHMGADGGNIVKAIGDYKIPDEFWEKKPWCEHCQTPRDRKKTYIIQNVSGEDKEIGNRIVKHGEMAQIASTCIKKYLGISTEIFSRWSTWADVEGDIPPEGHMRSPVYENALLIAIAYKTAKNNGMRFSKAVGQDAVEYYRIAAGLSRPDQNRNITKEQLKELKEKSSVNDEEINKAYEILNWAAEGFQPKDNFERNVKAAATSSYSDYPDMSVWIVDKWIKKDKQESHKGTVGQGVVLDLIYEDDKGWAKVFSDKDGDMILIKEDIKGFNADDLAPSRYYKYYGIVSKHGEYGGRKQTILENAKMVSDDFSIGEEGVKGEVGWGDNGDFLLRFSGLSREWKYGIHEFWAKAPTKGNMGVKVNIFADDDVIKQIEGMKTNQEFVGKGSIRFQGTSKKGDPFAIFDLKDIDISGAQNLKDSIGKDKVEEHKDLGEIGTKGTFKLKFVESKVSSSFDRYKTVKYYFEDAYGNRVRVTHLNTEDIGAMDLKKGQEYDIQGEIKDKSSYEITVKALKGGFTGLEEKAKNLEKDLRSLLSDKNKIDKVIKEKIKGEQGEQFLKEMDTNNYAGLAARRLFDVVMEGLGSSYKYEDIDNQGKKATKILDALAKGMYDIYESIVRKKEQSINWDEVMPKIKQQAKIDAEEFFTKDKFADVGIGTKFYQNYIYDMIGLNEKAVLAFRTLKDTAQRLADVWREYRNEYGKTMFNIIKNKIEEREDELEQMLQDDVEAVEYGGMRKKILNLIGKEKGLPYMFDWELMRDLENKYKEYAINYRGNLIYDKYFAGNEQDIIDNIVKYVEGDSRFKYKGFGRYSIHGALAKWFIDKAQQSEQSAEDRKVMYSKQSEMMDKSDKFAGLVKQVQKVLNEKGYNTSGTY